MQRILSYLISPIVLIFFAIYLGIFHVAQVIAFRVFGYEAHKKVVDALNWFLLHNLWFLGSTMRVSYAEELPVGRPMIIVANHQSLYDIVGIIWFMRKYHVKFVSKIELGSGLPSISYNLKHGGSVLIDRKDNKQAIAALMRFGKKLEEKKWSACIFPEGTRSRDGKLKPFAVGGVSTLLKYMPSALVVPVAIGGTGKLHRYGQFPMGMFSKLSWQVLPPFERGEMTAEEVTNKAQSMIAAALGQA